MNKTFDILLNSGFRFEHDCVVEAKSAIAARKIFKAKQAGTWKEKAEIRATERRVSKHAEPKRSE